MKVFKPPFHPDPTAQKCLNVFLGGSIEMGKAIDWQREMEEEFKDVNINFFNPRRDDWNSEWKQTVDNHEFRQQVLWEMRYIDSADIVVFFIQGDTLSPITVGEIYYMAAKDPGRIIVACEPGFWKRGNLEVMAGRHDFILLSSLAELKNELREHVQWSLQQSSNL